MLYLQCFLTTSSISAAISRLSYRWALVELPIWADWWWWLSFTQYLLVLSAISEVLVNHEILWLSILVLMQNNDHCLYIFRMTFRRLFKTWRIINIRQNIAPGQEQDSKWATLSGSCWSIHSSSRSSFADGRGSPRSERTNGNNKRNQSD